LQCKILHRGAQLLEVGGRLVYSTCSLNPAEDEAVISDLLRSSDGAMELVEVADQLPGLKFTRGLSHWRVMTKAGEWLDNKDKIPPHLKTQYKESIYPPTPEEAAKYHLERCMRILPHHQDSGGFFVAVLEKKGHLPGTREHRESRGASSDAVNTTPGQSSNGAVDGGKRKADQQPSAQPESKKQKLFGYKEDPFLFLKEDDPVWPQLRDFFGLENSFPASQLMCRSTQGKRTIYFVSEAVRNITECNEGRIK
ncbi:tRNA (cytosine(34)-C(5))-methyltransferase, partial [Elysia marginata]